jgi:hypothetical protein
MELIGTKGNGAWKSPAGEEAREETNRRDRH